MERLTTRREDGRVYTTGQTWSNWEMCVVPCSRGNDRYDIRLAEYEDTGLTPKDVAALETQLAQAKADNAYVLKYAQDLCDRVEIWATDCPNNSEEDMEIMFSSAQQLKHVLSQSGHGADLLKELEQLREQNANYKDMVSISCEEYRIHRERIALLEKALDYAVDELFPHFRNVTWAGVRAHLLMMAEGDAKEALPDDD